MDSKTIISERVSALIGNPRTKALAIGVVVLMILAVLQVNNLTQPAKTRELFQDATISNADLQRIQIALSQSGLADYELVDGMITVPTDQHSTYLKALADRKAIPKALRQVDETSPTINPFLSRTQQQAIDRLEKKNHVRDMVLRLPVIAEAWLEMDKSESHSTFEDAKQSAVISVKTRPDHSLSSQDVDTIKRMIGGAFADLDANDIVVIDLCTGCAYHEQSDSSTSQQVRFQHVATEQKQLYENQIRDILKDYPGINVSVHVEVNESVTTDAVAATNSADDQFIPKTQATAGANSFASIEMAEEDVAPPVELVAHSSSINAAGRMNKRISVSIDVPQRLVHDLFGKSHSNSRINSTDHAQTAANTLDTDAKFAQLRSEIIQKVRPILPVTDANRLSSHAPITVNLIREPIVADNPWMAQAKKIAEDNWPSAAVLAVGLILLTMVTRTADSKTSHSPSTQHDENGDVVSIRTTISNESESQQSPEGRLTQLIEQDPDTAARVIEAWIRDAA